MSKILISHRGNVSGFNPDMENRPEYILDALNAGYQVEIDLWWRKANWYLGHDQPLYFISDSFLEENQAKLWMHAKNIAALENVSPYWNYFWHQSDDLAITSQGWYWVNPNKPIPQFRGIAVKPELYPDWQILNAVGICSDFVGKYK